MNRTLVAAVCLMVHAALAPPALAADGHWRELTPTGSPPDARKHFVMVYDATGDRVILYGGETHDGEDDVLLDDVWSLSLSGTPAWTELSPTDDATYGNPGGRHGHSGTIAPGSPGKLLIVGGRNEFDTTTPIEDFEPSSWALTLGSPPQWTRLAAGFPTTTINACPPNPTGAFRNRSHAAAAWLGGEFFLFGGWEVYKFGMQDMWRHSTSAGTSWSHRSGITSLGDICPDHPDRRYNHTLTTDSDHSRMILFGGLYEEDPISNAWYTDDGIDWTCLGQAGDYSRNFHASVYDPVRDRLVVLGGYDLIDGITDAVTTLPLPASLEEVSVSNTNTDWSELTITGPGPGAFAEHCAVYDSQRDRVIVFGGVTTGGGLREPEVWALEFDETAPATASISGYRGKNTAVISFTAPGDDGASGTAVSYDLRRSTATITSGNFASATPVTTGAPQAGGTSECVEIGGLAACTTYYYAMKTTDDAGNVSSLSNVVSMTQTCNGAQVLCAGESVNLPISEVTFGFGDRGSGRNSVALSWSIPVARAGEALSIQVFDLSGRLVRTIANGPADAGEGGTTWACQDESGARVPAGLYFARLRLGAEARSVKMMVE
jgi:hypothetical protein